VTLLTACMMVKNEERNLARCLLSLRPVVDEIVLIDTGSNDRTVEIAKEHGATVYHSPWANDFSYHRNESLEHARGQWCFVVDADEELRLNGNGGPGLREQLEKLPEGCHATRMLLEDIQDGRVAMAFQSNRIFRRGKVRYRNRKHNYPEFGGDAVTQLTGAKLLHFGYDGANKAGKKERDLDLLLRMRAEDPDNYQVLFWLAQTYGHYFGDAKTSLRYCEEYIQRARGERDFQPSAYVSCAEIARAAGQPDKAEKFLAEGSSRYPGDIDLAWLKVRNAVLAGDGVRMRELCETYLQAFDRLTKTPHLDDGRFRFYYNEESLAFVLHKIAIDHLYRGTDYLNKFYARLEGLTPAVREDLEKCMAIDLEKVGVAKTTYQQGE
jgi:glycosyltransferase involved in cell wall biosynthesis